MCKGSTIYLKQRHDLRLRLPRTKRVSCPVHCRKTRTGPMCHVPCHYLGLSFVLPLLSNNDCRICGWSIQSGGLGKAATLFATLIFGDIIECFRGRHREVLNFTSFLRFSGPSSCSNKSHFTLDLAPPRRQPPEARAWRYWLVALSLSLYLYVGVTMFWGQLWVSEWPLWHLRFSTEVQVYSVARIDGHDHPCNGVCLVNSKIVRVACRHAEVFRRQAKHTPSPPICMQCAGKEMNGRECSWDVMAVLSPLRDKRYVWTVNVKVLIGLFLSSEHALHKILSDKVSIDSLLCATALQT